MADSPCFGCAIHTITCHSECDRYKAWKAEQDAARVKRNAENNRDNAILSLTIATQERIKRRKGKK